MPTKNIEFFKDEKRDILLSDWIHNTYGRPARISRDEYFIIVDPDLAPGGKPADIMRAAGPTILLFTRWGPFTPVEFKKSLFRLFAEPRLKDLYRPKGTALLKRSDAVKLYAITESFIGLDSVEPIGRANEYRKDEQSGRRVVHHTGPKVYDFTSEIITSVRVKDKKSRREVTVAVTNGNAFDAQAEALKRLYGEEV